MVVLAVVSAAGAYACVALLTSFVPAVRRPAHGVAISAVAAVLAAAAVFAPGRPTGLVVFDAFLRAALVAACVVAASSAKLRWLAVAAVAAAAVSYRSPLAWVAALSFAAVLALLVARRDAPVVRAAVGGGIAIAVLTIRWPSVALVPSLLAFVVLVPVVVSGYRNAAPPSRRRVRRAALAGAGLAAGATLLAGIGVVLARPHLERGASDLEAGIDASRHGDREAASVRFAAAARDFSTARASLGPLSMPALLIPGVAPQVRVVRTAAGAGGDVSARARDLLGRVDESKLRVEDGRFPVEVLTGLRKPLHDAMADVDRTRSRLLDTRSPWLFPPLDRRLDDALTRLDRARHDGATAVDVADHLPAMLGADGARRWFLAVQTTSEARAAGGMPGSFGEISADRGDVRLDRVGRISELNDAGDPATRRLIAPADYVARYARFRPEITWQNVTMSPDFPTVATVIEQLYPQSGGDRVDGVIAVDPAGLAAILSAVGPVRVPQWPDEITAQNAEHILLYDEYVSLETPERVNFLGEVTREVWRKLTTSGASLSALANAVGKATVARHFQISSAVPVEEAMLERLGAAGAMPPVTSDFLGVVNQNGSGNKIDWFLRRTIDYSATVDTQSRQVHAKVRIALRNESPPSGLTVTMIGSSADPPLPTGLNRTYLSVYTPWQFERTTVDGADATLQSERELGRWVYSTFIDIPPGATRVVELDLSGTLPPGVPYRLDIFHQPTVVPDQVAVAVTTRDGATATTSRQELSVDANTTVSPRRR